MNGMGFRFGGAAVAVVIGFALTAMADIGLDILSEVSGLAVRRWIEDLTPSSFSDQYAYVVAVGFFSALSGIFIAENAS